jgi:hypothetical protein
MRPIVHGLEAKYAAKIDFIYLDIDDPATEPIRRNLGFRYQPEFYLVDDRGNVIHRWLGYAEAPSFEVGFAKVLGK